MFGSGTAYVTQRTNKDDGIVVLFGLEPEYLQCFEKVFYGEWVFATILVPSALRREH
jgi:shikimate O-hydroxycinnamoyltransferase